jgi:hypothetical protein
MSKEKKLEEKHRKEKYRNKRCIRKMSKLKIMGESDMIDYYGDVAHL